MYNIDNLGTLETGTLNDFINNYRQALKAQYGSTNKQLEQNRRQARVSAMSAANKAGMLYSNFPERTKMAYDAQTYEPALIKNRTSYQTARDSLKNNAVSLWNNIKSYEEAIQDLNSGIV